MHISPASGSFASDIVLALLATVLFIVRDLCKDAEHQRERKEVRRGTRKSAVGPSPGRSLPGRRQRHRTERS